MASPLIYPPRCAESSTTTGTGNFTLSGALTNYRTLYSGIGGTGATYRFVYTIIGDAGQTCAGEWETGWGYLSAAGTMVRDCPFQSSNSNAAVNFSAGTKSVMITHTAMQAYGLPFLFGTGEDGDYTVPASDFTLTEDKHWRNVTFASATASRILTNGFIIYAAKFDVSNLTSTGRVAAFGAAGSAGSTSFGGAGGDSGANGLVRGARGGTGGSSTYYGATSGGGQGGETGQNTIGPGGRGGDGGAGSTATGGKGGRSGAYFRGQPAILLMVGQLSGAGGGGGGGGHNTTTAASGGGGGTGGPGILICCAEFARSGTVNPQQLISSSGGGGASGTAATYSGAGGGGGGGFVGIICARRSGSEKPGLIHSVGGSSGSTGVAGTGGYSGALAMYELEKGIETYAAPVANTTTTGGSVMLAA